MTVNFLNIIYLRLRVFMGIKHHNRQDGRQIMKYIIVSSVMTLLGDSTCQHSPGVSLSVPGRPRLRLRPEVTMPVTCLQINRRLSIHHHFAGRDFNLMTVNYI